MPAAQIVLADQPCYASQNTATQPQLSVKITRRRKTMSNWLIAVLFGVGVLAAAVGGRAVEQPTPSASAKPDDKGKDRKPAFRAGAVRYQVKDVDRSLAF